MRYSPLFRQGIDITNTFLLFDKIISVIEIFCHVCTYIHDFASSLSSAQVPTIVPSFLTQIINFPHHSFHIPTQYPYTHFFFSDSFFPPLAKGI